jgi:hypothetical protein
MRTGEDRHRAGIDGRKRFNTNGIGKSNLIRATLWPLSSDCSQATKPDLITSGIGIDITVPIRTSLYYDEWLDAQLPFRLGQSIRSRIAAEHKLPLSITTFQLDAVLKQLSAAMCLG